jgi:hypothetical protein
VASRKRSEEVIFVRCSPRLKRLMEEKAKESRRTLNSEAVVAFERHVRREEFRKF